MKEATPQSESGKPIGVPGKWQLIIAALFAGLVFFSMTTRNSDAREKVQWRNAITLCWQDRDGEFLSKEDKRSIARKCEKMESEFVRDYGVSPN